jgi:hypothetical protein
MNVTGHRTLLFGLGLFCAALGPLAPRPAAACAMEVRFPRRQIAPPQAEELLARAGHLIDRGAWTAAAALAGRVVDGRGPRPEQRAAALAILGWSAWRTGARARALVTFRRARQLDAEGKAVEDLLARVKAPEEVAALRAALEAA